MKSVSTLDIKEDIISINIKEFEKQRLHYFCIIVFMQVFIGKEEYPVMELVNKGSELNIITQDAERKASLPIRNLKIKSRGIGGHMKSLVGKAEFTQIPFPSGEEKEIHLFSSKGALHTVLGRQQP
ncbi:hypothetical protein O181_080967 [Austropuccinia psidii MF-1]|uniref:Uncharacterized protein n=1 Tax=Austropuccinia psidii MF-1 TaxID=1389203 RepID=A0A9Q3FMM4_9BASI|nr:hypothetical protein [Austropuccinia psidii MF-1]